MVRDEDRTVLTMVNDYQGELKEFAIVVPVLTVLEKEQINVGDKGLVDHLDAYSAPRLVEYFDENPCEQRMYKEFARGAPMAAMTMEGDSAARAKTLGVTIEAQYTVGEYDILILSAKESGGLITWLKESGYRLPKGAEPVLGSYIKQNLKFFVAKVNLEEQAKSGYTYLRPIQVAYNSPKFMLPIRLGTVNANGPQDLIIYALTRKGRVQTTNYRTVTLPEGMEIPVYVKDGFADFYRAMFDEQVKRENMKAVFLEYAWDMSWCDPCAADPLTPEELRKLGVYWVDGGGPEPLVKGRIAPGFMPGPQPVNVYVTRLHVRYTGEKFPEDLVFEETQDRENFQARYVLRHPWKGTDKCSARVQYDKDLKRRHEQEAKTLANLTGWDVNEIRKKMKLEERPAYDPKKWWLDIWQ